MPAAGFCDDLPKFRLHSHMRRDSNVVRQHIIAGAENTRHLFCNYRREMEESVFIVNTAVNHAKVQDMVWISAQCVVWQSITLIGLEDRRMRK